MEQQKFIKLKTKYDTHKQQITDIKNFVAESSLEQKSIKANLKVIKSWIKLIWKRMSLKLLNKRYLNQIEKRKRFTMTMAGNVWWKTFISKFFQAIFLAIIAVIIVFPFYWMITTSFKPFSDIDPTVKETFWPKHWTLDAYKKLFSFVNATGDSKSISVWTLFGNSLYIALISTVVEVIVSLLGGFALYNWKTKFNKVFVGIMFALVMVPGEALLLGRFIFAVKLGWKNNVLALIVPFIGNVFTVYLMANAFKSMGPDLKNASKIDGLSTFKFFWKIAVPAIKSTVITSTIISFVSAWNSTLWPVMIMDNGGKNATIPMLLYGLMNVQGADISPSLAGIENPINFKMAAATISIIPILIVFIVLNKPLMRGLSDRYKSEGNGAKG